MSITPLAAEEESITPLGNEVVPPSMIGNAKLHRSQ
eukprot:CAMPEP_0178616728 /NCGR_PEP_ID=MMETSP0698-20121128/3358_1 /TAXON_ID=265572 /ORGANISM="Extubocellulus spinifer, Strain CCMP396" /LENGTH=35 /DNA_ID= /DNA_START= /DNA_END= /DNA_ORIENTATION=